MAEERSYTTAQALGLGAGAAAFAYTLLGPPIGSLTPDAQRALGVTLLMSAWWLTEALPIWVTAMLPIVLLPLLGLGESNEVTSSYGNHFIFLFMGGLFIASAMERWGLHRRLALYIIRVVGSAPRRLILGFMVATAFLSMWISNTASTMMVFPIAMAVLSRVSGADPARSGGARTLMLSICYGANIGGIATLIGTPTNVIFASVLHAVYPQAPEIGFVEWFRMGLPFVVIFIPIAWALLVFVVGRADWEAADIPRGVIREELRALGPITAPERRVLIVFVATALLWIFRRPIDVGFARIPGWSAIFPVPGAVADATVSMFSATILFLLPAGRGARGRILEWEFARQIPWGILMLLGGGFALAGAFERTGLSAQIGHLLEVFGSIPTIGLVLAVSLVMTFLTEVTANASTTAVMLPILAATATNLGIHPFLLMIPATLSASCAFMLPVATPPNAIVFGSGYV
ncbi:MAG: SLC13/DASS family transporter, partial [Myxococcales bacterium]|nr:SLC13/DASS family transporter [Myxococcales bacterium]